MRLTVLSVVDVGGSVGIGHAAVGRLVDLDEGGPVVLITVALEGAGASGGGDVDGVAVGNLSRVVLLLHRSSERCADEKGH